MTNDSTHDPNEVISEADSKFAADDVAGAQMVYQTALLDWVDDATFGSPDRKQEISNAIATLWVAYANMNRRANLFKAATEAFESAINCPVAGSHGKIWSEYAAFQRERNRHKTAQKIYIRALVGENGRGAEVSDEGERDQLWLEFLDMMQKLKPGESLTLEQLQDAVEAERASVNNAQLNQTDAGMNNVSTVTVKTEPSFLEDEIKHVDVQEEPLLKRAKLQDVNLSLGSRTGSNSLSASDIEAYANEIVLRMATLPPGITAEWLARDGNSLPSTPPLPLFSPSPPRLSDPSGKEMLGTEISLKLIRMLLGTDMHDTNGNVNGCNGEKLVAGTILDLCKACWIMTALKESEAWKCTEALDQKLKEDVKRLDADLEARLSVAGAALTAVQQINMNEKNAFLASCNQQRQYLQALISWEFRQLLATQQQILTDAGLPEFAGPTIDSVALYKQSAICSFLHSAFYLRSRIGEDAHLSMLKSQEARLANQPMTPLPLPVEWIERSTQGNVQHEQYMQHNMYQYMHQGTYAQQGLQQYL